MQKVDPGKVVQGQLNSGKIRSMELVPELLTILEELALEINVGILVNSGGQMELAEWEKINESQPERTKKIPSGNTFMYKVDGKTVRIGSVRHDGGYAGDIAIYHEEGTYHGTLDDNNPGPLEKKLLQQFVALGIKKGLKGFGAGPGYMDRSGSTHSTMHVDVKGTDIGPGYAATWGKKYLSANTPDWLREVYNNPTQFEELDYPPTPKTRPEAPANQTITTPSPTAAPAPTVPIPAPRPAAPSNDIDPYDLYYQGEMDQSGLMIKASYGTGTSTGSVTPRSNNTNQPVTLPSIAYTGSGMAAQAFGSMFPGTAANVLASQLPQNLQSYAPYITQSFVAGGGVGPLNELVSGISGQGTTVGRIRSIGDFVKKYPELTIQAFPELSEITKDLPLITGLLEASPRDRIKIILENEEAFEDLLKIDIPTVISPFDTEVKIPFTDKSMVVDGPDYVIADLFRTDSPVREELVEGLKDFVGSLEIGSEVGSTIPGIQGPQQLIEEAKAAITFLESDDPTEQAKAIEILKSSEKFGGLLPSETDYLSMSPEEIIRDPAVKEKLDQFSAFLDPEADKEVLKAMITRLVQGEIKKQGLDFTNNTTQSLLFGTESESQAKDMRTEASGKVLDKFIESNDKLASIIKFFNDNQGLLTLLGSTAGLGLLTNLLGGGIGSGLLAGAGGVAATRFVLGEEGFSSLLGNLQGAAAPGFDFLEGVLDSTGLRDVPILGDILGNMLGVGRSNPLAALSLMTGNIGGAAGILGGTAGVNLFDNEISSAGMLEDLMNQLGFQNNQVLLDLFQNTGRKSNEIPFGNQGMEKDGAKGDNNGGVQAITLFNSQGGIYTYNEPGSIQTAAGGGVAI